MGQPGPSDEMILVTGGAGFIGSHLVEALNRNNQVRVLDDFSTGDRFRVPTDVSVIEGDVRDSAVVSEAVDGVDIIYHEAAMVDVDASIRQPRQCNEINIDGTLSLLEAARERQARIVVASSAAVYGTPDRVPISESDPLAPLHPYGVSKLAGDCYGRLFDDLYDLECVVLRYFNVYGPGQSVGPYSGVINVFLEQAKAGEPITVHGDGAQTRDFVHVDDVVAANLRAGTTHWSGEAYNIGTGDSVSILQLAQLVKEITGTDADIVTVPGRDGDVRQSRAAIEKAQTDLGYSPSVQLRDGLEALVERDDFGR